MISLSDNYKEYKGEIEFIIKDRNGNTIDTIIEPNIVKIYAKEIISHRIGHSKIWDPVANSGTGGWVQSTVDPNEEFAVKYILFGASFDENGVPLDTNDSRFYETDSVTQTPTPLRLMPGADYDGGLINAVPLAEPNRPLKRIENIDFETTYQPAGTPLLQEDVRALNNIVLFETTLLPEEYNGFNLTDSDFFTITEVALAAGKELDSISTCECDPKSLFLEGNNGVAFGATASGTDVITLSGDVTEAANLINIGDSIKIVSTGGTADSSTLDQISPYYLVINKSTGGRDLQLDRVPVNNLQTPITGSIGVFRNTLRIFSHRILKSPVKKTSDIQILVRWRIYFN